MALLIQKITVKVNPSLPVEYIGIEPKDIPRLRVDEPQAVPSETFLVMLARDRDLRRYLDAVLDRLCALRQAWPGMLIYVKVAA